jgi:hypothetical protein
MRHLLLTLTLLAASSSFAAAPVVLRDPVEVPLIGFKAALDDGQVVMSWKHYKRDDFVSYRVVKSDAEDDPVYPAAKAIYTATGPGDTEYVDGLLSAGTWRYRVCILTRFGDRWVSPVVAIVIKPEQTKRSAPTAADFEP